MSTDWYPGIRSFCAHWRHAPMLQQTFETFEKEFTSENDACIDAAKGLVECACRLLIQELDDPSDPIKGWRNSPIKSENPNFKDWVSATFKLLEISDQRDDPFNKVISQHYKLTDELGAFRKLAGTISHGKDGLSQKLSVHHRRSAILAADALITFLHEVYLERDPDPVTTFEPYERFNASKSLIDENVAISADADEEYLSVTVLLPGGEEMPLVVEPSRFLFGVDREAYKTALNACRNMPSILEDEIGEHS